MPVLATAGSSPLARGLPGPRPARHGGVGIIPARAGFTGRRRESGAQCRDHPRSRGVYGDEAGADSRGLGSSPLARGLPAWTVWGAALGGIIPARAGFTHRHPGRHGRGRDHPRSRGVYTVRPATATPRTVDHPRSRGVYLTQNLTLPQVVGSSPLARGLRRPHGPTGTDRGIIPARAGFTADDRGRSELPADHPRSRGVYGLSYPLPFTRPGSSPLARGLQSFPRSFLPRGRIIPARAGFTRQSGSRAGSRPDHPRSRGVYVRTSSSSRRSPGSSPLARGLPVHVYRSDLGARIIPARAGFTPQRADHGGRGEDHPRSRGVYVLPGGTRLTREGSSPLARGLRRGRPPLHRRGGIIPARAGFTSPASSPTGRRWDHPRSRGVYVLTDNQWNRLAGSSPLARGLPRRRRRRRRRPGIIPARAGFTYG